jgi:hypothetical protein
MLGDRLLVVPIFSQLLTDQKATLIVDLRDLVGKPEEVVPQKELNSLVRDRASARLCLFEGRL